MEEAIEEAGGTLRLVERAQTCPSVKLGPTVFAPVEVNGVPTKALVDTGSPATTISLQFVLKVLANQWTPVQSVHHWKQCVRKKFSSPSVALQNYGGHRVDIIAQIEVTLSQGRRKLNSTVFVQQNAPNDLLLGTDTRPTWDFPSLLLEQMEGTLTSWATRQPSLKESWDK